MALIYTKLTDKTTVLAPREGACRKFNFGDDWTEVRVGVFWSAVAATGSNDDSVVETLVPAVATDYVTLGLKDDSQTYPGQAGSLFIGARSYQDNLVQVASAFSGIIDSTGGARAVGYVGTTLIDGGACSALHAGSAQASLSTAYASFSVVKFVITDRGLSTQTVTINTGNIDSVAGADYSATALRTAINNYPFYAPGAVTIAWNDGAAARDIPDCVWLRSPLYLNSLRISAIRAIRYAP